MEKSEMLVHVKRIVALYPNSGADYMAALASELWVEYGSRDSAAFMILVTEALKLSEFPPNLATFARAEAKMRERQRDARGAGGYILQAFVPSITPEEYEADRVRQIEERKKS